MNTGPKEKAASSLAVFVRTEHRNDFWGGFARTGEGTLCHHSIRTNSPGYKDTCFSVQRRLSYTLKRLCSFFFLDLFLSLTVGNHGSVTRVLTFVQKKMVNHGFQPILMY